MSQHETSSVSRQQSIFLSPFAHRVNGKWYLSSHAEPQAETLPQYKTQVRTAYGSLRGVQFAQEGIDYQHFLLCAGELYPAVTRKYELTVAGFDAKSDQTDDRVLWVRTTLTQEALIGKLRERALFPSKVVSVEPVPQHFGADFNLPDETEAFTAHVDGLLTVVTIEPREEKRNGPQPPVSQ